MAIEVYWRHRVIDPSIIEDFFAFMRGERRIELGSPELRAQVAALAESTRLGREDAAEVEIGGSEHALRQSVPPGTGRADA